MSRPFVSIYLKTGTIAIDGMGMAPDLPPEILQHSIRSTQAYSEDLTSCVSRIEIETSKLGSFRSELAFFAAKRPMAEIVPNEADKIKYKQLDRMMDPKNNPDPFEDAGR